MKLGLLRLAALSAAILTANLGSAGENDVLYWMVDGAAEVQRAGENTTVRGLYDEWKDGAAEGSAFAARVRVTGSDIVNDTFLDLYITDYGVDANNGDLGVIFSGDGDYWGAGVPTGAQAPIGDYSSGSPEYSFIIELGNIDSDDNWTTVATSAASSYTSLGNYIHQAFDLSPQTAAIWAPSSFQSIPEPSGGLLLLMGVAILALRRRENP